MLSFMNSKIIRQTLKTFLADKSLWLIRRWDILLVFFVSPIVIFLTAAVFNERIDAFDEGLHFLNYAMFKAGKVPYIDYYPVFPPLWTYSHIIWEWLFGEMLLIQRMWFVVQGILLIVVCYLFLRMVLSSRFIALGMLSMIVAFGLDPFWLPRWSGMRLAVYILFFILYWRYVSTPKKGEQYWQFFLGMYVGVSNLYAFDVGIHLTATGVFILFATMLKSPRVFDKKTGHSLITIFTGFALPLIIWAVYLRYHGVLIDYIVTYYYLYLYLMVPISAKMLSGGYISLKNYRVDMLIIFLVVLTTGLIYLVAWRGMIKKNLTDSNLILMAAIFLTLIVSGSSLRGTQGPQYLMFAFIPMLFWIGFLVNKLSQIIQNASFWKQRGWFAIEFSLLIPIALLSTILFKEVFLNKINALKTSVLFVQSVENGYKLKADRFRPATLKWQLDSQFDDISNYLSTHTGPDESILAFPINVEIIPALAKRHSATRYPVPILLIGSSGHQKKYISDIEREKPRYLVFFPEAKYGGVGSVEPFFEEVYEYIYEFYRPVYDFPLRAGQQIWVRKG